ncbi:MAG: PQQ-dependent sugar dehydrogenase [Pseudomonadota bacterium]
MTKLFSTSVIALAIGFSVASTSASADPWFSRGFVPVGDNVTVTEVADNLRSPWGVATLPDGTFVITERGGTIRTFRDGKLTDPVPFPVAVMSERYSPAGDIIQGQGGLLDVIASPDFATDHTLFFSYAIGDLEDNRVAIGKGEWRDGKLENFEEIFRVAHGKRDGQHFGSRLAFLPDGTLIATVGDGGNPPLKFMDVFAREQAQNLQTHFGSVIRINTDGSAPADNPFVGVAGAQPEIWSFGHRNPQGLVVDPDTGTVWSSEHGPQAGDELNRIERENNYGWPRVTYGRDYRDGSVISANVTGPEFTGPSLSWIDTHAPGGLTLYTGTDFPEWEGALLSAGLASHDLRVIGIEGDAVASEERITIGSRVRDTAIGPDGGLFVLTDGPDAKLLRIDPSADRNSES